MIIFHLFVELPAQKLYMINPYKTTFETLAEIERDCKERQLNSAWEIDQLHQVRRTTICAIYRTSMCEFCLYI